MAIIDLNPDTSLVTADEIPFVEMMEGVELRFLRIGEKTGTYTIMTRFEPGIELPKHKHFGEVHAYTLEGQWNYLEYPWVAKAGDYVYEPPGSIHTLKVPNDAPGPAVVFFTIDKGMALLDENDVPWHLEDAWSLYQIYVAALEARGIPEPEGILP